MAAPAATAAAPLSVARHAMRTAGAVRLRRLQPSRRGGGATLCSEPELLRGSRDFVRGRATRRQCLRCCPERRGVRGCLHSNVPERRRPRLEVVPGEEDKCWEKKKEGEGGKVQDASGRGVEPVMQEGGGGGGRRKRSYGGGRRRGREGAGGAEGQGGGGRLRLVPCESETSTQVRAPIVLIYHPYLTLSSHLTSK